MAAQQKESVKGLGAQGAVTRWRPAGHDHVERHSRRRGIVAGSETITVEEAAIILNIARNSAYAAVHNGQLPGVWIGKRFLVSVPRLKRMIDGETAA